MLNPNENRLDYGEILAPLAEFFLDFAVGTTYSLNLDALVGASLALGLSCETDSAISENPVCLLEALHSTADKVALFCEAGQIGIPSKVNSLYILLEKMVFPVIPPKRRNQALYPTFHPKLWLVRYVNAKKEKRYRFIVLSRNLTFDHNWDVSFYMDGYETNEETDKNEPLRDFLNYLLRHIPAKDVTRDKIRGIRSLIRDLPRIVFDPGEKSFYDYEFIPNGVKRADGSYYRFDETNLFKSSFHEILIMSPFLSGDIIRSFNNRNVNLSTGTRQYSLFTREMSLSKLKPDDVSNFKIYTMKDKVIDGESAISDETKAIMKQDIHAKVYLMVKNSDSNLYLGSLNASHNAVYGNVEFMLRLKSKFRYMNLEKLQRSLFCGDLGDDCPFQEVTLENAIVETEDEGVNTLENVAKSISRLKASAEVVKTDNERFSLAVRFEKTESVNGQITIRPLLSNREQEFRDEMLFEGLEMLQLSEFFVVSVSDGEKKVDRVLVIPTRGFPEDREKTVITSVVNDNTAFCRYIAFLLGDESIIAGLDVYQEGKGKKGAFQWKQRQIPALYEKMLKTAVTNPERFKGIEYLMQAISDDGIIPNEFAELYSVFKKVVTLNG